jgi:predicted ArsR family transcriptional regulator
VTKHGEAILAALHAKSPQRPGEIAKRLKVELTVLRYHVKPLLQSRAVVASGATMNRQWALPPGRAAKEVP